jgi:hypothetical protein
MAEAPTPKQPLVEGNQQQHHDAYAANVCFRTEQSSEEIAETTPEQGANRKKRDPENGHADILPRPEREPRTFRQVHHNAFARMQENDVSAFLYLYNSYFN